MKGNEMNVCIKEVELDEKILETLIRMSETWAAEQSCHGYRKNGREDIEGNRIFLACDGETVLGYLFGHAERAERDTSIMPKDTPYFEVEELFTKPAYRGQGIGRRLFEFAERAVSDEVEFVMLTTATKNWNAILHFYLDELGMEFWSARLFRRCAKHE